MSASLGLSIFLGTINLLVVCGNLAVLYIVVSQKSLHTSTNTIVFSLTLSDFLLGCLILPFSITQEFSNSWAFGTLWCKSWLSLDILLSTASIYNLLAISFDRYMAVKQPIKYGRLISSSRLTKFNISAVWLISASLAVPPFLSDLFMVTASNEQMNDALPEANYSEAFLQFEGTCTPVTNSDFYILFSATISFILPMILMQQPQSPVIRKKVRRSFNLLRKKALPPKHYEFYQPLSLPIQRAISQYDRQTITSNSRKPTIESYATLTANSTSIGFYQRQLSANGGQQKDEMSLTDTLGKTSREQKRSYQSILSSPTFDLNSSLNAQMALNMRRLLEQERLVRSIPAVRQPSIIERTADRSVWFPAVVTSLFAGSSKRSATICRRQSEKLLLYPTLQFAKTSLRTELRVARTIAVVVGCFTCCWLPFTIIYAFQFCPIGKCIPEWLFTLAFWLGYSNSALNPILYAAFSRDFRNAFCRLLTRDRNSSFKIQKYFGILLNQKTIKNNRSVAFIFRPHR
uniref:G-protein coupled receptors family 1 profile domain-containing protein n=1 Tax=Meloidogyne javanica TaxID=6303 RepID=A0A915LRX7_MELJA